jgi:protein arginine kinase activator
MLCDKCKKNLATFHKSIIINGKGYETHLCSYCASLVNFENDINFNTDFDFSFDTFDRLEREVIKEFFNDDFFTPVARLEKNGKKCPECNSTFNDFLCRGKLGCSHCYDVFQEEIRDMLENMDNPTDFSLDIGTEIKKETSELDKLNNEFNKAIAEERYEDAGEIKKKINNLREKDKAEGDK